MTPALLLQFFAILAGGACFIAFLCIVLVLVNKLISPQGYYEEEPQEELTAVDKDVNLNKEQLNIYTNGIMRGSSVVFISIYKCWKDNNDVPLIGGFDELRADVGKNLDLFSKEPKVLDAWVDKYNQYFKDMENNK